MTSPIDSDLPSAEEREALLDALAGLCAKAGPGPLVAEPVLPTSRWFPDAWDGREGGLERLARRMLDHAGLGHLGLELDLDATPLHDADRTAAWFAGIVAGRVRFGVRTQLVGEPMEVAAALAHEVAHAWREAHGAERGADERLEELLTDVTTVYLGFGVLTTNGASLQRTSGTAVGYLTTHTFEHARLGYLSPGSLAFLLAAQLVAQGADRGARAAVHAQLEHNQAAAFQAACRVLLPDAPRLRRRLGIPASQRPVPRARPAALAPVEAVVTGDAIVDPTVRRAAANVGRNVFRVRRREPVRALFVFVYMGFCLALAIMFLNALLTRAGGRMALWLDSALAVAAAAWLAARHARLQERCSEPKCETDLLGVSGTCPGCGGTIRGTIRHANERLEAEEELAEEARAEEERTAAQ